MSGPSLNDQPTPGSRQVLHLRDLDEGLLFQIEEEAISWLGSPGDRDWEDFLQKIEGTLRIDLPSQMDDPVIRKIQKASRAAWAEANL